MDTKTPGWFEVLDGHPDDIVAVSAHGRITRSDYDGVMIPLLTTTANACGRVKLLYILGQDFDAEGIDTAWEDAKLGFLSIQDFERIAVVTDIEWVHRAVKMFAPLICRPVSVFALAQMHLARTWLQGGSADGVRALDLQNTAG